MNLGELRTAFRSDVDDTVADYLWSNDDFERYLNDAEREACRRANLLIDSNTAEVCKITVLAGQPLYELDSRVVSVRRAKFSDQSRPLIRASYRDMDAERPGWEDSTSTLPTHMVVDFKSGYLRLYPTPTTAKTLWLIVKRLPMQDMSDQYDEPEINSRLHESLLHWVKYKAYLKKDPETLNEPEALKHLALFEEEFGPRKSAVEEEWAEQQYMTDSYDGNAV